MSVSPQRVAVIGLTVLAIRPEPDVEKALQTPTREQLQADADRATFERRALAVERERAIAENELATKIELAARREALVSQEGTNARREAEEAAAAGLIAARAAAERTDLEGQAQARRTKEIGEAEASAKAALLGAYGSVSTDVLKVLAFEHLAGSLPRIGSLTITPDMLTQLASTLTEGFGNARTPEVTR
jgi:uncharacterized membrane protein YqiK